MSLTVWKTVLKPTYIQEIEAPVGSEFLTAREQFEDICIWYRCNSDAPLAKFKIAIVGTGHPAPDDGRYLGSASLHGGSLIFHVFVSERQP